MNDDLLSYQNNIIDLQKQETADSDISTKDIAVESGKDNNHPYTVSELCGALKAVVENNFDFVRVKGEISGLKKASSEHLYFNLKDEKSALINAVCWSGKAKKIAFAPEDGMEVVCSGRISVYKERSNYQMIVDGMELAGSGALMMMLEKRKNMLAQEGLFEQNRKRKLPWLPEVIGVITSPTGSVIRDILHRIEERFPRKILLWPVLVQGDGAAEQVANAIAGFNRITPAGKSAGSDIEQQPIIRPDLLIVARGGGSLEDLWAFNEEIVVRAIADSKIPIISAIGHETDTSLADYAADKRAPTPTAAAEMAVPVIMDIGNNLDECQNRMLSALRRVYLSSQQNLRHLSFALQNGERMLESYDQRMDFLLEKFYKHIAENLHNKQLVLMKIGAKIIHPSERLKYDQNNIINMSSRLQHAMDNAIKVRMNNAQNSAELFMRYDKRFSRVSQSYRERIDNNIYRLNLSIHNMLQQNDAQITNLQASIEAFDYKSILNRGYVLLQDKDGKIIKSHKQIIAGDSYDAQFSDGHAEMIAK